MMQKTLPPGLVLAWFGLLLALAPARAQQTVGLFQNDSTAFAGYTLFAPNLSTTTYLIDNCGELVNSWESTLLPGMSAYLLPDGRLARAGRIPSNFNGGGSGGRLEMYSWEGDLLWEYTHSSAAFHHHHDFAVLPNGNLLLIAWEHHSAADAESQGRAPNTLPPGGIWSEQIVELQPLGPDSAAVVWQWHLWDHLVQDFDPTLPNFGTVADHPELVDLNYDPILNNQGEFLDWVHLNSIDYHPELDQIVVSSRHFSEVWVIDHSTTTAEAAGHTGGNSGRGGDLLYRFGNPAVYDRGGPADQALFGQHDANWIAPGHPGAGEIMVFNNGINRPAGLFSTVETWQPPLNADGTYQLDSGEPFGPDFFAWEYQTFPAEDMFAANVSGATRLPNGNTLICEGPAGHLREVDLAGNLVWRYISPIGPFGPVAQGDAANNHSIFRAYRYGLDYPAFHNRDLTPQGPLELNPDPPLCLPTSTASNPTPAGLRLVQNPASDFLQLENPNGGTWQLLVQNARGQAIFAATFSAPTWRVPVTDWPAGLYFLQNKNPRTGQRWSAKFLKT